MFFIGEALIQMGGKHLKKAQQQADFLFELMLQLPESIVANLTLIRKSIYVNFNMSSDVSFIL